MATTANHTKRTMRNPEAWIGKRIPRDMDAEPHWRNYDKCDDCQCLWYANELYSLLWPMSDADMVLQQRVGVEEAQSFCPVCLTEIERDADRIDPGWRQRRMQ